MQTNKQKQTNQPTKWLVGGGGGGGGRIGEIKGVDQMSEDQTEQKIIEWRVRDWGGGGGGDQAEEGDKGGGEGVCVCGVGGGGKRGVNTKLKSQTPVSVFTSAIG